MSDYTGFKIEYIETGEDTYAVPDSDYVEWLEGENAELKKALSSILEVTANNFDHDMHRIYKIANEAMVGEKKDTHKCRTIPTPRELKLGIGPPMQCPKCRASKLTRSKGE